MDARQAVGILGLNYNPKGVCERNMITALQMHLWMNTTAEDERLAAALWAAAHQNQFNLEQQRRRNLPRSRSA